MSSKPTHRAGIGAVLALVVACGAGSSTGAGESGGASGSNTGVASSCPCSGGLVCAVGACWEPCGPGGACKSGFVCLKDQACVMLEGYPLPDGEVVRKGLAGTFTTYQVSGDWLFLVGDLRPGAAGLYAAKLGSGAEPELRATLPVTGQHSLPNVVTYGNKVYYADGTGHAFVSAVEPWDPKPIPTSPFSYMIPSPARDTVAFLQFAKAPTVRGLSTATGELLGPELPLPDMGLLVAPEGRTALVTWRLATYPEKWDLSRVDLVTGERAALGVSDTLSGAGYPLKDTAFGTAWAFGSALVRQNERQGTLTLLDTSKPGGEERGFGNALNHVGVAEDGFYVVAPSARGRDLVHIAVPSGAATSLGWLRSKLQASWSYRPQIVVDGPWVYALDLHAVGDPANSTIESGWVYRFRR